MTPEQSLSSWASLNKYLPTATEKDAEELLKAERARDNRLTFLIRIYGRYNKLRTQRERNELARSSF